MRLDAAPNDRPALGFLSPRAGRFHARGYVDRCVPMG